MGGLMADRSLKQALMDLYAKRDPIFVMRVLVFLEQAKRNG